MEALRQLFCLTSHLATRSVLQGNPDGTYQLLEEKFLPLIARELGYDASDPKKTRREGLIPRLAVLWILCACRLVPSRDQSDPLIS